MNITHSSIQNDFPIFSEYPNLTYLDNGATTQKPQILMAALTEYYTKLNSNVGRGYYHLAQKSEEAYFESKKIVSKFFNCNEHNIIFSSGATESSNLATFLSSQLLSLSKKTNGKVITSILEHHSNFLPLQQLAKNNNMEFVVIDDVSLLENPDLIPSSFWTDVQILSLTHVSNTTGRIIPVAKWISNATQHNPSIITIIDGSQAVSSMPVNISEINPDFYYFSAHKFYGPMGLGVLYISDRFVNLSPLKLGGGIVDYVNANSYTLTEGFNRFEAGTPNVANAYAFGKTLEYFSKIQNPFENQKKLAHELFLKLHSFENDTYKIFTLDQDERIHHPERFSSLLSFIVLSKKPHERGLHSHDIGNYLTERDICIRFGKHCAHPLHDTYNVSSTVRASFAIYNNSKDIDKFMNVLNEGIQVFEKL